MLFYFQPNFKRFLPERVFHLSPAVNLVKLLSLLKQTDLQNHLDAELKLLITML